ncbi:hypothetical protein ACHAO7_011909, partial [Fusarium culmorum]
RYVLGGYPEPLAIFNLINELDNRKIEVDAEIQVVSLKQSFQLKENLDRFMNNVSIKPKAKLPCHVIRYPKNPSFRGRQEVLERMEDKLLPSSTTLKSYALYGFGGVGKTQLALQFCYSHAHVFQAIFWISADTEKKIKKDLLDVADQLGCVDTSKIADQDKVIKDFMAWLRDCDDAWLMIFDNADDITVLKDYWPSTRRGSILVTSRDPAILLRTLEGEQVSCLDAKDANDMFFTAIQNNICRNDENEVLAKTILEQLGYLPLAIRAAAGIIVQDQCSLEDFIELCEECHNDPEPFAHLDPDVTSYEYSHTLATVWNIALQTLSTRSTKLLRIMTYLDPDAVPLQMIRKGSRGQEDIRFLSAMSSYRAVSRELLKNGLCSKATLFGQNTTIGKEGDIQSEGLTTHRLILQTVFHRCSDAEKEEALTQAVAMLVSEFPPVNDSDFRLSDFWRECHILLPQVEALITRCGNACLRLPRELIPVLCACGRYLLERRSFKDSERMFVAAQTLYKMEGLEEWEQAQFVQRSLGGIILESSVFRNDEAVQIFQEVVEHYERTRDPDDPVLGVTYSDLAQALTAKGEYDRAIGLCERALEIVNKIEDSLKRRDTVFHVHHNLARIYEMKKMPEEALHLHLYEGDPQGDGTRQEQSVYGAWNLYAIGNCLQLQKDPRAIETHSKALKIRQDLLGDHYYTAMSYHKLGRLYLDSKAFKEADRYFGEANKILDSPLDNTKAELARNSWYWSQVKKGLSEELESAKLIEEACCIGNQLIGQNTEDWRDDEQFDKLVTYYNR